MVLIFQSISVTCLDYSALATALTVQAVLFSDHFSNESISCHLRVFPEDAWKSVNEDNRLRAVAEGSVHGLMSYEMTWDS